jgi:RNA polymerase sigma-70 factor (ECF subfamily)
MENKTDLELIKGIKKGCNDSFQEIVNRYTQKVYNLSMRLTRNIEDAEEVLQDVFVTVYNKIEMFEGKSQFSSWLYRVTANTAFMKLRKRKAAETVSFEEVSSHISENYAGKSPNDTDVNHMSCGHELRNLLDQAISKLPEEYKNIFVLRDVDGLSNEEVAEVLSLTVPAVKSRLHRARLLLRKKLQRYYDDYSRSEIVSFGKNMTREIIDSSANTLHSELH